MFSISFLLCSSLRSWRYCKRTLNKVLAAEPTSERRSREENRECDFESPLVSGGSAAKTLFRERLQYRQLRRLHVLSKPTLLVHQFNPLLCRKKNWMEFRHLDVRKEEISWPIKKHFVFPSSLLLEKPSHVRELVKNCEYKSLALQHVQQKFKNRFCKQEKIILLATQSRS